MEFLKTNLNLKGLLSDCRLSRVFKNVIKVAFRLLSFISIFYTIRILTSSTEHTVDYPIELSN